MLEWPENEASVLKISFPPAGAELEFEMIGLIGQGTLELSEAGDTPGAAWSGVLNGDLYESP